MTDPIIARTIESAVLLRSGGEEDVEDEVLATYSSLGGDKVFAICRGGIVVDGRYIANVDVERVRFFVPGERPSFSRRLVLHLISGEMVPLPIEGARGQFLDIFAIEAFLRRRVHQARRAP